MAAGKTPSEELAAEKSVTEKAARKVELRSNTAGITAVCNSDLKLHHIFNLSLAYITESSIKIVIHVGLFSNFNLSFACLTESNPERKA